MMRSLFHQRLAAYGACQRLSYMSQYMDAWTLCMEAQARQRVGVGVGVCVYVCVCGWVGGCGCGCVCGATQRRAGHAFAACGTKAAWLVCLLRFEFSTAVVLSQTERRREGLQIVGASRRALSSKRSGLSNAKTATVGRAVLIGAGSAPRVHFWLWGPMRGGFCQALRLR